MRNSRPYPIYSLLSNTDKTNRSNLSIITKIQQRAVLLLNINRAVTALLPMQLRPWCRVANFYHNTIVLETANANWKMRLLYEQPQLILSLKKQILPLLISMHIKVNPNLVKIKVDNLAETQINNTQNNIINNQFNPFLKKKTPYLSTQSASSIKLVATHSTGTLKNALEQLAKLAVENITNFK